MTSNKFCISTPILKLEMAMYMICNITTNGTILKLIQWSKTFVKLDVHTIEYVPLLLCALPTPQQFVLVEWIGLGIFSSNKQLQIAKILKSILINWSWDQK